VTSFFDFDSWAYGLLSEKSRGVKKVVTLSSCLPHALLIHSLLICMDRQLGFLLSRVIWSEEAFIAL